MISEIRVLITGSREESVPWGWLHRDWTWLFQQCLDRGEKLRLVHGACPTGVDEQVNRFEKAMSETWWAERPTAMTFSMFPLGVERHPAGAPFWSFGPWPAAGPKRNQYMVSLGADLCLAYPYRVSKGTRNCMKQAIDAGIPVLMTEYPVAGLPAPLPERLVTYLPGFKLWKDE